MLRMPRWLGVPGPVDDAGPVPPRHILRGSGDQLHSVPARLRVPRYRQLLPKRADVRTWHILCGISNGVYRLPRRLRVPKHLLCLRSTLRPRLVLCEGSKQLHAVPSRLRLPKHKPRVFPACPVPCRHLLCRWSKRMHNLLARLRLPFDHSRDCQHLPERHLRWTRPTDLHDLRSGPLLPHDCRPGLPACVRCLGNRSPGSLRARPVRSSRQLRLYQLSQRIHLHLDYRFRRRPHHLPRGFLHREGQHLRNCRCDKLRFVPSGPGLLRSRLRSGRLHDRHVRHHRRVRRVPRRIRLPIARHPSHPVRSRPVLRERQHTMLKLRGRFPVRR
jgi:hypothetical protein